MNQQKTNSRLSGVRYGTGTLLRLNLAPLMGRRDAAYDAVAEYAAASIVSPNSELLDIIESAMRDSADLLNMLSSPDTIDREQHMLEHIRKLVRLFQMIKAWDEADPSDDSGEFHIKEQISAKITQLFRDNVSSLELYRAYAAKSASPSYAKRYQKSYSFYLDIYNSRLTAAKTVEI